MRSLDPGDFKQRAAELGLTEFGEDPFAGNFARLIQALNDDGELSELRGKTSNPALSTPPA